MESPRDVHLDWVPRDALSVSVISHLHGKLSMRYDVAWSRADFGQLWASCTKRAFWIEDYLTADLPIVVDLGIF